jgi:hypothetical protein
MASVVAPLQRLRVPGRRGRCRQEEVGDSETSQEVQTDRQPLQAPRQSEEISASRRSPITERGYLFSARSLTEVDFRTIQLVNPRRQFAERDSFICC